MSCHSDVGGCSLGMGRSLEGGVNVQHFIATVSQNCACGRVPQERASGRPPQEPGGLRASSAGAGMSCHVMSVMYMSCHVCHVHVMSCHGATDMT